MSWAGVPVMFATVCVRDATGHTFKSLEEAVSLVNQKSNLSLYGAKSRSEVHQIWFRILCMLWATLFHFDRLEGFQLISHYSKGSWRSVAITETKWWYSRQN